MTTRLASSTLFLLLTAALVTACFGSGDPGNGSMITDAMPPFDIDYWPPEPDAAPAPFAPPEGGELRLERFQLGPDDADAELAAQALFFTGQEPPLRTIGGVPIELRVELTEQDYVCLDLRDGHYFDSGKSPETQAIVDSRAYYDVGATATLTNAEVAEDVITLERFLAADDPTAATDRASGLVHDVLYKAPVTTPVARHARYLPAIAGSPAYPYLDLAYGEAATGEELTDPATGEGTPQIFMPSAFTMTSPAEADFYAEGALVFTREQDLELTYAVTEAAPEGWPTILPFIDFVNDADVVEAKCLKLAPGKPEDGRFIVPYEVLEVVQADPGGHAVFGRMIHVAWETRQDRTRMDLIGIESKVARGFVIQDATAARE